MAKAQYKNTKPIVRRAIPKPQKAVKHALASQGLTDLLQTKLRISNPGDKFEQEADRVADSVMRMPDRDSTSMQPLHVSELAPTPYSQSVQRICDECEEEIRGQPEEEEEEIQGKARDGTGLQVETDIRDNKGGGQPLPVSLRNFFEPRFGYDFSHVRVHADSNSAGIAERISARAYTIGADVAFAHGEFQPDSTVGRQLLAHELAHVVQQGAAAERQNAASDDVTGLSKQSSIASSVTNGVVQRAGDPAEIPPGFPCPFDLTPGRPPGTDILFDVGKKDITGTHVTQLVAFVATWVAGGGADDILVHGYSSTDGDQGPNWTLSCDRAQAVHDQLITLGVPPVRVEVVAHGESTDFGSSGTVNRHAIVSTSPSGIFPFVTGTLTAADNFAGRSSIRFGVDEDINLDFLSIPLRPATDFGGLEWNLASGGGILVTDQLGVGSYTAPGRADSVTLELVVASGATAGTVISTHDIDIVEPDGVNMTAIPGSTPGFSPAFIGQTPAGTWGAGMLANVFVDPKDVSFQGVVFGEDTIPAVTTGSFIAPAAHPPNTFGAAHGGNATTGTAVSPPPDRAAAARAPAGNVLGVPVCGASTFLWAIPWEFSVAGAPRVPFAIANQRFTSTLLCDGTVEKAGAGPFCRSIDGSVC